MNPTSPALSAGSNGKKVRLDVLVEGVGRQNFGCDTGGWDTKGLQSPDVMFNGGRGNAAQEQGLHSLGASVVGEHGWGAAAARQAGRSPHVGPLGSANQLCSATTRICCALAGTKLSGWRVFPLQLDSVSSIHFPTSEEPAGTDSAALPTTEALASARRLLGPAGGAARLHFTAGEERNREGGLSDKAGAAPTFHRWVLGARYSEAGGCCQIECLAHQPYQAPCC